MRLGAYYWDGWYEPLPHWTERLLNEFPNRMPVWGWQGGTVRNMEMQIDLAADAGLEYFSFDWYYPQHGQISGMNNAVERFLQASNRSRMKFCLLIANHDGGRIFRDKWDDFCAMILPLLTAPEALRVDDKPVLMIFAPENLAPDLGGHAECRRCIAALNELARQNGLKGVYLVAACHILPTDPETLEPSRDPAEWDAYCRDMEEMGFDALSGYNYHRLNLKKDDYKNLIYPFEQLSADYVYCWNMYTEHSALRYLPCVNGGWDCRPWETIEGHDYKGGSAIPSCYSPDRTPYTQYRHVKEAGEWMKAHADRVADDLAIIYAWNENGEGGFIEPTVGFGDAILKAVGRGIREANEER